LGHGWRSEDQGRHRDGGADRVSGHGVFLSLKPRAFSGAGLADPVDPGSGAFAG
jgi:hypothetical protein